MAARLVTDFQRGQDRINLDILLGNNRIDSFSELSSSVAAGTVVPNVSGQTLTLTFDNGDELEIRGIVDLRSQDWIFTPISDSLGLA